MIFIKREKKTIELFLFFLAAAVLSRISLEKNFIYPFTFTRPVVEKYAVLDLSAVLAGARRLGADIAWIQLLQYYGTSEEEFSRSRQEELAAIYGQKHESEEEREKVYGKQYFGKGVYPDFLGLSQRVIRLDPFFYYAYTYSGASLAWNLDRPGEGIALLDEGIRNKPDYWQFLLYKQAIIYKRLNKDREMIYALEKLVDQPGAPTTTKAILANTYKRIGDYRRALNLWIDIYESGNVEYHVYADREIRELRKKLRI